MDELICPYCVDLSLDSIPWSKTKREDNIQIFIVLIHITCFPLQAMDMCPDMCPTSILAQQVLMQGVCCWWKDAPACHAIWIESYWTSTKLNPIRILNIWILVLLYFLLCMVSMDTKLIQVCRIICIFHGFYLNTSSMNTNPFPSVSENPG